MVNFRLFRKQIVAYMEITVLLQVKKAKKNYKLATWVAYRILKKLGESGRLKVLSIKISKVITYVLKIIIY
jgi:hypothetical protein